MLGSMALMVACGAQAPTAIPTLTPAPTPQPTATLNGNERDGIWFGTMSLMAPGIDHDNWKFDIGGNGWGNSEAQTYTDRPENAY